MSVSADAASTSSTLLQHVRLAMPESSLSQPDTIASGTSHWLYTLQTPLPLDLSAFGTSSVFVPIGLELRYYQIQLATNVSSARLMDTINLTPRFCLGLLSQLPWRRRGRRI